MKLFAIILFLAVTSCTGISGHSQSEWDRMSVAELEGQAAQLHPAAMYILASKLFKAGNKDEAVFWFYAGQLRYRFHLKASPNLDSSGDPALFTSLFEVIGRPINEYAFGDITTLAKTIQRVLDWDDRTANNFTSKSKNATALKAIRDGLSSMRSEIEASKEQIYRQRESNGLKNRA